MADRALAIIVRTNVPTFARACLRVCGGASARVNWLFQYKYPIQVVAQLSSAGRETSAAWMKYIFPLDPSYSHATLILTQRRKRERERERERGTFNHPSLELREREEEGEAMFTMVQEQLSSKISTLSLSHYHKILIKIYTYSKTYP